jgi:hypothetical protein
MVHLHQEADTEGLQRATKFLTVAWCQSALQPLTPRGAAQAVLLLKSAVLQSAITANTSVKQVRPISNITLHTQSATSWQFCPAEYIARDRQESS